MCDRSWACIGNPRKIRSLDWVGSKWSQLKRKMHGLLSERRGAAATLLSSYPSFMYTGVSHGGTGFSICLTEYPSCFWSDPSFPWLYLPFWMTVFPLHHCLSEVWNLFILFLIKISYHFPFLPPGLPWSHTLLPLKCVPSFSLIKHNMLSLFIVVCVCMFLDGPLGIR